MSEITPERIAELRAVHEATSFPWCVEGCTVFLDASYTYSHGPVSVCSTSGANNAKSIAAARNALPGLLDEIERLRHALEVSQGMVDRLVEEAEKKDAQLAKAEAEIQIARRERSVLMGCMEHFTDEQLESVPDGELVAALRIMTEADKAADYHTWADGILAQNKEMNAEIERLRALESKMGSGWALVEADKLQQENEKLRRYAPDPFDESLPTYATMVQLLADAEAEIEALRALLPKAFDAGLIAYNVLGEAFREEWIANALKEIEQ